jgi:hypothetical protein
MPRVIGRLMLLATLALWPCAGCASGGGHRWWGEPAGDITNPDYGTNSTVLQGLSNASINDWNFRGR